MNRKGFPESYDTRRLIEFLRELKSGAATASAPVYSHVVYDILDGAEVVVRQPDIVIVEGLNMLQVGGVANDFVSDYFDFSIYIDAEEEHIEEWYVQRFLTLCDTVFQDPNSFFRHFAHLTKEEAVDTAGRLLSLDPSQEVVHRTLMRLQLDQGRADAALRRYEECRDILRREYHREPVEETERLHREILAVLEREPAPREVRRVQPDRPTLVLVVEDDLVSSALIESYLTSDGYEVAIVADGGDALIELGRRHFDLLVLDINIPTLSGLKVFEIMLQKQIDTPALFITGMPGVEVEMQSLEMGAAGFLRKPIRKEVLLPKIRGILQRSQRDAGAAGC